jgi:hypothetical protein
LEVTRQWVWRRWGALSGDISWGAGCSWAAAGAAAHKADFSYSIAGPPNGVLQYISISGVCSSSFAFITTSVQRCVSTVKVTAPLTTCKLWPAAPPRSVRMCPGIGTYAQTKQPLA